MAAVTIAETTPPPPGEPSATTSAEAGPPGTNNLADLRKLLLVAMAAILIGLFPFASGLIGSLMLCTLLRGAHRRLLRIVGARASAFILAIGTLVTLLLPGAWLLSTIIRETRGALATLDIDEAAAWLSRTRFGSADLSREVANIGSGLVTWLSGHAVTVVGTVTSAMLNVLIALFGLYYLLLAGDAVWSRARRFLPMNETTADALASRFVDVTDALLLGTLLTGVLQGTLVGVAFAIVGFHPPIVWGFVTACASVLPLLGSALVWLPGVVVLLVQHRPGAAVFLLVVGAGVVSNLDNLARPFVYRRVSGIHPMLTLVGAFAGVRMFGLIGAFLGPLILSYFLELLDVYDDARRRAVA
jgi:predicted PurR-regulated permease PerM